MKVVMAGNIPIKMWLDTIEEGALAQAINVANLPFIYKHVALMPDAHQGFGVPIGSVVATKEAIIPSVVGLDIGCGMHAVKTNLIVNDLSRTHLEIIGKRIREVVPVGFKHQEREQSFITDDYQLLDCWNSNTFWDNEILRQESEFMKYQLGTLGSGNHFAEVQHDSDGVIWFMIHSGSRNLGKKVADYYHDLAKQNCTRWHSAIPTLDLAFLPLDSDNGKAYLYAMNFCLLFARANRQLMADNVLNILADYKGYAIEEYDVHHNYARMENHFSQNVMVHRKGATSARKDEIGIIPGSMGTNSYITRGLGNPESFMSSSHGAGRRMGRKEAQRSLDLTEQQGIMGNIVHGMNTAENLEEAPGAYKDIDTVMENQKDLVEIVTKLYPLLSIKG